MGGYAQFSRDIHQPVGVRRVARADHQHQIDVLSKLLDGVLAVLGGVTDVIVLGAHDRGELLPQCGDDLERLVHRKRRLGDVGNPVRIGDLQLIDLGHRSDQLDRLRRLAHGADDLLVALVSNQDDRIALGGVFSCLGVHLGDQRAGRVQHVQLPLAAALVHLRSDAVGRQHHHGALRDIQLRVDEHGAAISQLRHNVVVVHDLLAHVHRGAEVLEGALHRVHSSIDPCAVTSRRRE